ncbi:MAG: carboxypeptidase regulatory-like domain-containing protein [Chloroflexota bacterium]
MKQLTKKPIFWSVVLILVGAAVWFNVSNNDQIWPIRNFFQYQVYSWWWDNIGAPDRSQRGTLQGVVRDEAGNPVDGATILVADWEGTTYQARSDDDGRYTIHEIPIGSYQPVAAAPDYDKVQFGNWRGRIRVRSGAPTLADVTLPLKTLRAVSPGQDFSLTEPKKLSCTQPVDTEAHQQQIYFDNDGEPNQDAFYYTPVTTTTTAKFPLILVVYPGPAASWECASLSLTKPGYAVLAVGPAYSFDLETDLDEIERVLIFAREGEFPQSDSSKLAIIGGSYSSLHVQRLLQREVPASAALLLGPPTDLFDMRRRLENGTFTPPFGLDQGLRAIGFPNRETLRYWQYSGAYHVDPDFPPMAVLHSRDDDVVPYQQSELLAKNLTAVEAPHELYLFEGGHYLLAEDNDADTLAIYDTTIGFLDKHLR